MTSSTARPANTFLSSATEPRATSAPLVEEGDAVAPLGLVQVVGGDDEGDALGGEVVDDRPEAAAGDGIDAARGLVEEDQARVVEQRAGEGQPLLPAAGERPGDEVLLAAEVRHADGPVEALGLRRPAQAVDPGEEVEVLPHGQLVVEAEALGHVADAAAHPLGVAGDVDPQHPAGAGGGRGAGRRRGG